MHASTGARGRRALLAPALALAVTVLGCHTASASLPVGRTPHVGATSHRATVKKVKVDPRMFGVHDANLTSLTHSSTRSIRLWDAGTTWPDLEPTEGDYVWSRLDSIVRAAHRNGTEVTLVLGLSPTYAAAASTDAPDLRLYKKYVHSVMTHYRASTWGYRGIAAYQVWNEANIATFWTGTGDQLAELTKAAYDVRNHVDPGVRLIAPAMVTRLKYEQAGISRYYSSEVPSTHKPVWKYVDAVGLNLYPTDTVSLASGRTRAATPEDSMSLLSLVRGLLAEAGVPRSVPIWNTEVNYGMRTGSMGGHPAISISADRQVAYVIRTFLLNAANGVKRVDWYAYDMGELSGGGTLGNTLLTDPSDRAAGSLTAAGKAFTRVRSWLTGGTLVGTRTKQPCIRDRSGTYTCTIRYSSSSARVYWNPYGHGRVKLAPAAHRLLDEHGRSSTVTGGSQIRVGYRPVLVRSTR